MRNLSSPLEQVCFSKASGKGGQGGLKILKILKSHISFLILTGLLLASSSQAFLPPESEHLIPFRIVQTGLTMSMLEVCGCPDLPLGGVASHGFIVESERQGVDRFLLFSSGHVLHATEPVDRRIAEVYFESMALMGYSGMLVTESELGFGLDFLTGQLEQWGIPAVATNLSATSDVHVPWQESLYFDFPRLRVLVLGLMQPWGRLPEGFEVADPVESASRVLAEYGDSADLVVVLSSLSVNEERRLVREIPDIPLVLSSLMQSRVQRFAGAYLIHTSSNQGKHVNIIDSNYKPALTSRPFSFMVRGREADPALGEDPVIRGIVDSFYEQYTQEVTGGDWEGMRLFADKAVESLEGNAYLGAEACLECHTTLTPSFDRTRHSVAMLTLLDRNRHFMPECAVCHTTGYGAETGYREFSAMGPLSHVGCESCHGPGKLHVQDPARKDWIRRKVPDEHCQT